MVVHDIVSETLARGTGCGKSARPDLWGARGATPSPTRQGISCRQRRSCTVVPPILVSVSAVPNSGNALHCQSASAHSCRMLIFVPALDRLEPEARVNTEKKTN